MAQQTLNDPVHDGAVPTAAEVRAALERVLSSRCFERAARSTNFLRFVVAATLAGETERLKGYAIAVEVFGRPASFDARSDPLVRVEALRLRQRLTEYYADEGAADSVRLDLPRGGYAVKASYTRAPAATAVAAQPPSLRGIGARLKSSVRVRWAAAAVLAIATVAALVVQQPPGAEQVPPLPPERAHMTKIVVVPFENLSGTPDLDLLAAGLTEEIMVRLHDVDLFVIATQAAWNGPSSALDGVLGHEHTYVLTGSVREHSGGARITSRIIVAESGMQLWSAAYDEPHRAAQQPALQAKVARDAAAAAAPFGPVFAAELELVRREAHVLELPDCQTRYRAFRRATDPALFPAAVACFESLVERRPELAHAWAGLAMLAIDEHLFYSGDTNAFARPLARASEAVRYALALDSEDIVANAALARAQYYSGDPAFVATAEKALALEPTHVDATAMFGIMLTASGDDEYGLELVARAQTLSPSPRPAFNVAYAYVALRAGEPCKAQEAAERMEAPNWFVTHVLLGASAALCGDAEAAAAARRRLLALWPDFEAEGLTAVRYWRFDPALEDAVLRGLRQAGLDLKQPR
jgi:adenylate cyclase